MYVHGRVLQRCFYLFYRNHTRLCAYIFHHYSCVLWLSETHSKQLEDLHLALSFARECLSLLVHFLPQLRLSSSIYVFVVTFPYGDTLCPSVILYSTDVPCSSPVCLLISSVTPLTKTSDCLL